MTQLVRVTCINKTPGTDPHERIQAIGGINPDGSRWRLPLAEAIAGITRREWVFYVERPVGTMVEVQIAHSSAGHPYLKTVADGIQPDNLLALPECP